MEKYQLELENIFDEFTIFYKCFILIKNKK